MPEDLGPILVHLLSAAIAGGCIGLERSFHGRPAGFRTHSLVCISSSLLMLVTLYQWQWLPGVALERVQTDPTRMAQGIMTGIGFLGAGVIVKEGLSVRGLTTAASIWSTAAIGILMGIGFYLAPRRPPCWYWEPCRRSGGSSRRCRLRSTPATWSSSPASKPCPKPSCAS
jgi:putative Mg2+ transporter-C (MgtC) family protein